MVLKCLVVTAALLAASPASAQLLGASGGLTGNLTGGLTGAGGLTGGVASGLTGQAGARVNPDTSVVRGAVGRLQGASQSAIHQGRHTAAAAAERGLTTARAASDRARGAVAQAQARAGALANEADAVLPELSPDVVPMGAAAGGSAQANQSVTTAGGDVRIGASGSASAKAERR